MNTPRLGMPYIIASQAQKEVTHAVALNCLDALVQPVVAGVQADPPVSPDDGACYLVTATASGAWTGQETALAHYIGGAWQFYLPGQGWQVTLNSGGIYRFDGSAWQDVTPRPAPDGVLHLAAVTVATLPAAAGHTGGMVYVSDASGGAVPAYSDGTSWRRLDTGAVVA